MVLAASALIACTELPEWVGLVDAGGDEGIALDIGEDSTAPYDDGIVADTGDGNRPDADPLETCNGRDDDGDGRTDEQFRAEPCMEGEGRCALEGNSTCQNGRVICEGTRPGAADETCNGIDDDCDETIDEGFDLDAPCSVGLGLCENPGVRVCLPDGSAGCSAEPLEVTFPEECDGIDSDCDGAFDEEEGSGRKLTLPCQDDLREGECRTGEQTCIAADGALAPAWTVCMSIVDPEASDLCDGRDEDCNGIADDGFDLGDDCDIPLFGGGGICLQRGVIQCRADGLDTECQPRPESLCNGIDDNCDGIIDDGPACAASIARDCRAWLGWTTRDIPSPSDTWGTCPQRPELAADLSCNGSGVAGAGFGQLNLFGDLDADGDRLGVRFACTGDDPPGPLDWISDHCALYLGVARAGSAPPDGAESWSVCPAVAVGGSPDAACTSGDARFRPMPLPIDLGEGAVLGAAFRCTDADAGRAAAMTAAVEVLIAWADDAVDEADLDWPAICSAVGDGDPRTACVSTGGDGRFHAMVFTADVNEGDRFAIHLRPRAVP